MLEESSSTLPTASRSIPLSCVLNFNSENTEKNSISFPGTDTDIKALLLHYGNY